MTELSSFSEQQSSCRYYTETGTGQNPSPGHCCFPGMASQYQAGCAVFLCHENHILAAGFCTQSWIYLPQLALRSPLGHFLRCRVGFSLRSGSGKNCFGNKILIWKFDLVQEACFKLLLVVGHYCILRTLTHLKIIESHITGPSSWETASKTQSYFHLNDVKPKHFNSNEVCFFHKWSANLVWNFGYFQ